MEHSTILTALHSRHATKRFDADKKINEKDFRLIIEAARLSPSSFGIEPWNIVILQDMDIRKELMPFTWGAQKQLPTASHFALITAKTSRSLWPDSAYMTHIFQDIQKLSPDAIQKRRHRLEAFFADDFKLMQHERTLWDWAGKQAYIALANMMTSAALLGIDSCAIEGFQAESVENILQQKGIIDGVDNRLVVMAAFGYSIDEAPSKKRRLADEVVTWIS